MREHFVSWTKRLHNRAVHTFSPDGEPFVYYYAFDFDGEPFVSYHFDWDGNGDIDQVYETAFDDFDLWLG